MTVGNTPQQFSTGDGPSDWTASAMQELSDGVEAFNNMVVGEGLSFSRVGRLAYLNVRRPDDPAGAAPAGVSQFKVVRFPHKSNFVVCTREGGGDEEVEIALPFTLRAHESRGGVTYTYPDNVFAPGERLAKDTLTQRQQREVLSPFYSVGAELWAWAVDFQIFTTPDPTPAEPFPSPVGKSYQWLDANNDSRVWLALPIEGLVGEALEVPTP